MNNPANIIAPQLLSPGDTIALISPAKSISSELILSAKKRLEERGYNVLVGANASGEFNYFSGTPEDRRSDLQWALDHPDVKAIVCNRGGYGIIHLMQTANYANLLREPKWILGFSDVTNLHCLAYQLNVQSIHSTMPLNFGQSTSESLETLFSTIEKGTTFMEWKSEGNNYIGKTENILVGGNLAILYSLLGSKYFPDVENAILFIEDVGEQAYQLDRMLHAFNLAGVWDKISGLVVGGMTDISETAIPTQLNYQETILDLLKYRKIPIAFNAPIGHQNDNRAVIVGKKALLTVGKEIVSIQQL